MLKAGRVGVNPNQVDSFGNVRGASTNTYTKDEIDDKIDNIPFRVEGGKPQYKEDGEWKNFNGSSLPEYKLFENSDTCTYLYIVKFGVGGELPEGFTVYGDSDKQILIGHYDLVKVDDDVVGCILLTKAGNEIGESKFYIEFDDNRVYTGSSISYTKNLSSPLEYDSNKGVFELHTLFQTGMKYRMIEVRTR